MNMPLVEIYTDGSCFRNPGGAGGWAALLKFKSKSEDLYIKELVGGELSSTNNRMEMMGAIGALEALKVPCHVHLYTDSKYVQLGATEWRLIEKTEKYPDKYKNGDLWQRLAAAMKSHSIRWLWVKGHNGNPDNERVDYLANSYALNLHLNRRTPILKSSLRKSDKC